MEHYTFYTCTQDVEVPIPVAEITQFSILSPKCQHQILQTVKDQDKINWSKHVHTLRSLHESCKYLPSFGYNQVVVELVQAILNNMKSK